MIEAASAWTTLPPLRAASAATGEHFLPRLSSVSGSQSRLRGAARPMGIYGYHEHPDALQFDTAVAAGE